MSSTDETCRFRVRQTLPGLELLRHRFDGLDAIRGIAALLVAVRHVPFLRALSPTESFLAVDLFFLLSGVVLCDAYEARLRAGLTLRSFIALRIIRLYPLYLLGSLLGWIAIGIGYPAPPGDLRTIGLLALAMLPYFQKDLFPLDLPAWSLFFELAANIVYGILARVGSASLLLGIIAFCTVGLLGQFALQPDHLMDVGWKPSTMLGGFARVGFSFSMGILLRHIFERSRPLLGRVASRSETPWVILVLVTGILVAKPPLMWRGPFELGTIFIAFPALVLAILPCQANGLSRSLFVALGRLSYPLYVLHSPVARIVVVVTVLYGVPLPPNTPWTCLAFMTGMVVLCLWLDRVFDRPLRTRFCTWVESKTTLRDGRLESQAAPP